MTAEANSSNPRSVSTRNEADRLRPTLLAASLLLAFQAASAQSAAPAPADAASATQAASRRPDGMGEIQEVVVTAEKRGSTIQKTPISMTAIASEELQQRGVTSVRDLLNDVPGVAMKSQGAGQTEVVIRGMSSAAGVSPTVGFYLDEVPVAPPTLATAGKTAIDPDLYDLERVEVLRGPQGTLYGAGSMGGTVRLITAEPNLKRFEGSAQATASWTEGGGANGAVNAMVNVPLATDAAALRLVATQKHDSGWIDRVVVPGFPLPTGGDGSFYGTTRGQVDGVAGSQVHHNVNDTNLTSARAELLLKPIAGLTIKPTVFLQNIRSGGPDEIDSNPGRDAHYQPFDISEPFRDHFLMSGLTVDYDLGPATLVSATGYTKRDRRQVQDDSETLQNLYGPLVPLNAYAVEDGGAGPATMVESNPSHQFSQELRLASKDNGTFNWIVGAYYSRLVSHYQARSFVPGLIDIVGTGNVYTSDDQDALSQFALFGNANWRITPDLKLTAGVRHFSSHDRSHITASGIGSPSGDDSVDTNDASANAQGYNPMLNLSYDVSKDNMVYMTAAKGFRDGAAQPPVPTTGLNATCAADLAALGMTQSPTRYSPDTVWSYELGSKNRLLNNRMTLNGSVYVENWNSVQQTIALPCGWSYTDNAGNARVYGGELELTARLGAGFTLEQGVSYTHAAFLSDNAAAGTKKGDRLQGVPTWNTSTAISYDHSLNDEYSFTGRFSGDFVGSSQNVTYAPVRLPGYVLFNLRAGIAADTWQAVFFVNNVTNRRAELEAAPSLFGNVPTYDRIATSRPRTIGITLSKTY